MTNRGSKLTLITAAALTCLPNFFHFFYNNLWLWGGKH